MLVSVNSPVNWNYAKHNGLTNLAKQKKIEYLDLNLQEEIEIDWSKDTKDAGDHLNLTGAKKVTSFMGTYLKEKYNLSDYREEDGYVLWDEALKKVEKKLALNT